MFEPAPSTRDHSSFERMIFFSDAVIAIAITLLALEIRVPSGLEPAQLDEAIHNLLPRIAIYAMSFILVASFWLGHHRLFRLIHSYDDRLLLLNMLFLMGVAFLPVPSAALGEYGPEKPVVVFFAAVYVFIGLAECAVWGYASFHRRLIGSDVPDYVVRYVSFRLVIPVLVFAFSLLIALEDPLLAMLSWVTIFFAFLLLARWFRLAQAKQSTAALTHPAPDKPVPGTG